MELDNATKRPAEEMAAVLYRMQNLLGPLERWSDDALADLESRLVNLRLGIEREWIRREDLELD
jgi:hypothetical protein